MAVALSLNDDALGLRGAEHLPPHPFRDVRDDRVPESGVAGAVRAGAGVGGVRVRTAQTGESIGHRHQALTLCRREASDGCATHHGGHLRLV